MSEPGGNNLFQIAQVLKSNGTDGELLLSFRDIDPEEIDLHEPVFIIFDGLPVPFFVRSLSVKGSNKALVRLADVQSLKDAEEIVGKALYAEDEAYETETDEFGDLTGWTLKDKGGATKGTVSGIEDIPGNPCLWVDYPGGQAMVPLHEDLVVSLDQESRVIVMDIPNGLFE